MAKWKRGHGRKRHHSAASIYFYTDRTPEPARPDPYTHEEPEAIVAGLVQMEVDAVQVAEDAPLTIPEGEE